MTQNNSQRRKKRLSLNTRFVAIVSIALPLLILGWIAIIRLAQFRLDKQIREDMTFTLLLQEEMSDVEINALLKRVKAENFVKEVNYISQEQAALELEKELGENPEVVLGYNPLQASIEVHLRSEYAQPDSLPIIDNKIKQWNGVDLLSYRADMLKMVDGHLRQLSLVLLILSALLLLIAIIQINNTTHLLIYTRRFLIRTMTLLGAKPFFIRKPFISYSLLNGLWGGIIASLLLYLSLLGLRELMDMDLLEYLALYERSAVYIGLPVVGTLLSCITAFFSTGKYIRMDGEKLALS